MNQTRTATVRILKIGAAILLTTLIVSYAIWRSLDYARGSDITIFEPLDGATIETSTITIHGQAKRINKLEINGDEISTDEVGNFKETIIIFPGVNVITFTARDQFGRDSAKRLTVFGTHSTVIPIPAVATTTRR